MINKGDICKITTITNQQITATFKGLARPSTNSFVYSYIFILENGKLLKIHQSEIKEIKNVNENIK